MLQNNENRILCEKAEKIRLKLLAAGYAVVDSAWKGRVLSPTYSRLYFIYSGGFLVDGQEIPEGNCLLLPAGYDFSYGCQNTMEQVYIHLQLRAQDGMDLLRSCKKPLTAPFSAEEGEKMRQSVTGQSAAACLAAQQMILVAVLRLLDRQGIALQMQTYSPQIQSAVEYIRKNLSLQLTISQVAERAFLAPSALTRQFRREIGMSVGQYIDTLIFAEAEQLLKGSNLSVCEISERLGFCDQFYFARRFKEKTGLSPREYRKTFHI